MSAPAQAEGAPLPNIGTLQVEGKPIEVRCGSNCEELTQGTHVELPPITDMVRPRGNDLRLPKSGLRSTLPDLL